MAIRLIYKAYKPALLFINGEYWGIYTIMESKGLDYIQNMYGLDDIEMIKQAEPEVIHGHDDHYEEMVDFIWEEDMADPENYAQIEASMEIENHIDYWFYEYYTCTHDYDANIRYWRPDTEYGRWRWLTYDSDSWGRYSEDRFEEHLFYYESDYKSDDMDWGHYVGELVENKEYRWRFVNRYADILNTVCSPENMHRYIDEITAVIADEKERDRLRWQDSLKFQPRDSQITMLKEFTSKRPGYLLEDLDEHFQLGRGPPN